MRLERVPGGWYADALPNGRFVVRLTDRYGLLTEHGFIPFPTGARDFGGLLFPVLNPITYTIAGQAQIDARENPDLAGAWEWWFDSWVRVDRDCIGVSPCIYDYVGRLYVSHGGDVGSQGYRYIDPITLRPVTADASYGPRSDLQLYEWTDLGGGHFIGQGPKDGAWLRGPDLKYRQILTGQTRFIRAHRAGDQVSVACWVEHEPSALLWATLEELLALPAVAAPPPDVPVVVVVPAKPDLPPAPTTFTAHWIGGDCTRGALVPGNCAWGANADYPADARPVMVDVGDQKGVPPASSRPQVCGWVHPPYTKEQVEAEIARCKRDGVRAIYIHWDYFGQDVMDLPFTWADMIKAAGLLPVIGCNAVTRLDIYQAMLQGVWAAQHVAGSTINIRTVADRNPHDISTCAQAAVEQIRLGHTRITWIFGWEAQGMLPDRWPQLANYLLAVITAIETPESFPGVEPEPERPVDPADPVPGPVVYRPKPKRQPKATWGIIAAALAGFFAIFTDRRKRKKQGSS